eukprot:SAG31_NODE_620_length_13503_cov_11.724112_1_plen_97_part_00
MGDDYTRALDAQIAEKKRREAEEKLQEKAQILEHYEAYSLAGGPGQMGQSTGDLNLLIARQRQNLDAQRDQIRGAHSSSKDCGPSGCSFAAGLPLN